MFKLEYNAVAKRWDERMASVSEEKIKLIDAPIGNENLIKLKKSKVPIKTGDIFVLSPKKDLYFYGKVLEANIKNDTNSWINGCHVIFIFRFKSKTKDIKDFKADYDFLLCGPDIVTSGYWEKGFFETIGNIPLTEEEKNLDYGFFSMEPLNRWGVFKKANGELLNHIPKLYLSSGINVYTSIYRAIKIEAIIDPSLFE